MFPVYLKKERVDGIAPLLSIRLFRYFDQRKITFTLMSFVKMKGRLKRSFRSFIGSVAKKCFHGICLQRSDITNRDNHNHPSLRTSSSSHDSHFALSDNDFIPDQFVTDEHISAIVKFPFFRIRVNLRPNDLNGQIRRCLRISASPWYSANGRKDFPQTALQVC